MGKRHTGSRGGRKHAAAKPSQRGRSSPKQQQQLPPPAGAAAAAAPAKAATTTLHPPQSPYPPGSQIVLSQLPPAAIERILLSVPSPLPLAFCCRVLRHIAFSSERLWLSPTPSSVTVFPGAFILWDPLGRASASPASSLLKDTRTLDLARFTRAEYLAFLSYASVALRSRIVHVAFPPFATTPDSFRPAKVLTRILNSDDFPSLRVVSIPYWTLRGLSEWDDEKLDANLKSPVRLVVRGHPPMYEVPSFDALLDAWVRRMNTFLHAVVQRYQHLPPSPARLLDRPSPYLSWTKCRSCGERYASPSPCTPVDPEIALSPISIRGRRGEDARDPAVTLSSLSAPQPPHMVAPVIHSTCRCDQGHGGKHAHHLDDPAFHRHHRPQLQSHAYNDGYADGAGADGSDEPPGSSADSTASGSTSSSSGSAFGEFAALPPDVPCCTIVPRGVCFACIHQDDAKAKQCKICSVVQCEDHLVLEYYECMHCGAKIKHFFCTQCFATAAPTDGRGVHQYALTCADCGEELCDQCVEEAYPCNGCDQFVCLECADSFLDPPAVPLDDPPNVKAADHQSDAAGRITCLGCSHDQGGDLPDHAHHHPHHHHAAAHDPHHHHHSHAAADNPPAWSAVAHPDGATHADGTPCEHCRQMAAAAVRLTAAAAELDRRVGEEHYDDDEDEEDEEEEYADDEPGAYGGGDQLAPSSSVNGVPAVTAANGSDASALDTAWRSFKDTYAAVPPLPDQYNSDGVVFGNLSTPNATVTPAVNGAKAAAVPADFHTAPTRPVTPTAATAAAAPAAASTVDLRKSSECPCGECEAQRQLERQEAADAAAAAAAARPATSGQQPSSSSASFGTISGDVNDPAFMDRIQAAMEELKASSIRIAAAQNDRDGRHLIATQIPVAASNGSNRRRDPAATSGGGATTATATTATATFTGSATFEISDDVPEGIVSMLESLAQRIAGTTVSLTSSGKPGSTAAAKGLSATGATGHVASGQAWNALVTSVPLPLATGNGNGAAGTGSNGATITANQVYADLDAAARGFASDPAFSAGGAAMLLGLSASATGEVMAADLLHAVNANPGRGTAGTGTTTATNSAAAGQLQAMIANLAAAATGSDQDLFRAAAASAGNAYPTTELILDGAQLFATARDAGGLPSVSPELHELARRAMADVLRDFMGPRAGGSSGGGK
ncbi:hypothetical protein H9P43_002199 [Blastocladiella emersonii ATCC 22665]|nr:hypothetical protein H9P43_002199 [Blastocladiella emersonii ATCC 22665]